MAVGAIWHLHHTDMLLGRHAHFRAGDHQSYKSDVYYVTSAGETTIPMGELMETVKATLPDSVSITGVTVFSDPGRTYQVALSKPRRASLFIDQYSGEITGRYERLGFFSFMFKMHRWLLDSANPHGDGLKIGKLLVGISTIIFVIALITGIVLCGHVHATISSTACQYPYPTDGKVSGKVCMWQAACTR